MAVKRKAVTIGKTAVGGAVVGLAVAGVSDYLDRGRRRERLAEAVIENHDYKKAYEKEAKTNPGGDMAPRSHHADRAYTEELASRAVTYALGAGAGAILGTGAGLVTLVL